MTTDHTVRVSSGKYTFVKRHDEGCIDVLRHGQPWMIDLAPAAAVADMMAELDAARVVVQAARELVESVRGRRSRGEEFDPQYFPLTLSESLDRHDALVDDRELPSAWCVVSSPSTCTPASVPARPRNQYGDEMAVTEMCLELHQGTDKDRREELVAFLEYKAANWTTGSQFDDALRGLVSAALTEDESR